MELEGKVALVTGSARNIGRATVLELARRGADIVINTLQSMADADSVAAEIRQMGRRALVVQADVGRRGEVQQMIQRALDEFGRLDVLVNNASARPSQPFLELTDEAWQRVMDTTLNAAFYTTQAALPAMLERGYGRIINVIGRTAFTGGHNRAHVVAAKAGLHGLTRSLALEFAQSGVLVNSICLGYIDTERELSWYPHFDQKVWTDRVPVGRPGEPAEVAQVIAFLAGPGSSYITGQVIHVNGGSVIY